MSNCEFIECEFHNCNIEIGSSRAFDSRILYGSWIAETYNEYYRCAFGNVTFETMYSVSKDKFYNVDITDPCGKIESIPWANVCPEFGEFYAYKVLRDDKIAKLLIPADAKRTCNYETYRKCRAEYAKVIEITNKAGTEKFDTGVSIMDKNFVYKVGEEIHPDIFNEDRFTTCANGIHFFMSIKEAVDYNH